MFAFIPKPYKKEPITIRMSPEKIAAIDNAAERYDLSRSELINQCIDFALEHMLPPNGRAQKK